MKLQVRAVRQGLSSDDNGANTSSYSIMLFIFVPTEVERNCYSLYALLARHDLLTSFNKKTQLAVHGRNISTLLNSRYILN